MEELYSAITLEDSDGNELEFFFADAIEYEGSLYAVLVPVDDEDDEVTILRTSRDENGEFGDMYGVEDESVLRAVFELFVNSLDDE
ncbi:MAG: DUF1292 domain-containing protein [Clostridia bacterium]|nr:DUF1292 domain-containing protein [Clostridia bacterium]